MNKNKKLGFTLAEVLIVIGIIGVVAALTLPNLNHATGDKETVTRLQKAYSILNEANDRAVAIYGPISTWITDGPCANNFHVCYMSRIKEFLKVTKYCNTEVDSDSSEYLSCNENLIEFGCNTIQYQLSDGITFTFCPDYLGCTGEDGYSNVCSNEIWIDINGGSKGKNQSGVDSFKLELTDDLGIVPYKVIPDNVKVSECIRFKDESCTWWVFDYDNLDYLRADENGKCNDSNIILNGTTNTSCH